MVNDKKLTRLAVFASGKGSNFWALSQAMQADDFPAEIVFLVVDHQDAPAVALAQQLNLPVHYLNYANFKSRQAAEQSLLTTLQAYRVQGILLAGYMRILGETLIKAYPGRIVNIHPALLPNFPGREGIKDAYEAGVAETGVTIHLVDAGIDTGPIVAQAPVRRYPRDSLADLTERIHASEHELYPKTVQQLVEKGVFNP
ncbi:phosphoribosylglycinamide formyltransferase [Eupransor demetentiae]|uniref:Phosphoribosylglycinamide formyltransferase n=1 Tax=Eupransor demetentiae TaxID=3109584 RepID=A0ABM9N426_9LACO|nr:Folate-dependent phosphoribosylglycinamide formyltransferase PurN (PurN) [Lactobacillaceae bacterium LMG 33000]